MKANPPASSVCVTPITDKGPLKVVKQGSITVPIYETTNRIYRRNPATGLRELKSEHPQFTLAYYQGNRRVRLKFTTFADAEAKANEVLINLANGDSEALKLTGNDRLAYVDACQELRRWKEGTRLHTAVADYVAAAKRLPDGVSLRECVDFFLKRHPSGMPRKTVREVLDELLATKTNAGKSDIYVKELRRRLGRFADAFQVPIATVTGAQIEELLRHRGHAARTQNNERRLIVMLFKYAVKRGYLPKDHDELSGVERADDSGTDIEVFTPAELRKLLDMVRPEMVPYLAIAAFAGLRAAEIDRLDWSEVNLAERFIELKASKAKTASRRLAPIPDNLLAWLTPYAQPFGPVCNFERSDKQLFYYLAPKAGLKWKRNGLRHSFISYRLAVVKDVGAVSLEAGNSAQMIFKHYRQLVTEKQGNEWFSIKPGESAANVIPLPAAAA